MSLGGHKMKAINFSKAGFSIVILYLIFSIGCLDIFKSDDELCENNKCFSITKFAENLDASLTVTTLGYSYAIYYDNSLQKWDQNGQARRAPDQNVFDINAINTDMNIASCSKSITAIAVLQLLEANKLSVGTLIKNYLPKWWTFGPLIGIITFRDLLAQESGFRPVGRGETYSEIKDEIALGINANDYGEPAYRNMNFCILRIIIPILANTFDEQTSQSDSKSEAQTTEQFMNYLNTNVFAPMNVEGSCSNHHDVLYYDFSNPNRSGWNPGDECNKSGGGTLSLSANDLAKIMYYAAFTTKLLSNSMQSTMFNVNDPLGCYSNEVNTNKSWGDQFHHNGGITVEGKGARACWYAFHNGVVCAVTVNSAGGIVRHGYKDINDLIEQAFDASWTSKRN